MKIELMFAENNQLPSYQCKGNMKSFFQFKKNKKDY